MRDGHHRAAGGMTAPKRGEWTRSSIERDRSRAAAADALKAERMSFHAKYGERMCDGSLYPFGMCMCWGCVGSRVGTETERLE